MGIKQSEFKETINASIEKTWDVLFNQYGDVHIHNPGMIASNYMNNATKGELNCLRHCNFDEKLWLEEEITEFKENSSVTMVATKHNLPMLKHMSATYELTSTGIDKTEVKMTSFVSTSPGFMIYLIKGQLGKGLTQHLFGMKYYLETGKTVSKDDYAKVSKSYNQSS